MTEPVAGTPLDTDEIPTSRIGAFFDVDETLVRGATAFWAAREMFVRGLFGLRDLQFAARQALRFVMFGEDKKRIGALADRAARVVEGSSVEEMLEIGEHIFEEYFLPHVYQETYLRLKAHSEAGHQVWLISATPWIIAEVFARRLGASGGIGTRLHVAEGRLLGSLDGGLIYGPAKVEVVNDIAERLDLDLEHCWAYSDSASDIPMLSAVGNPVAVNPDRELEHYARNAGWEVLIARNTSDIVRRAGLKIALFLGIVGTGCLIFRRLNRFGRARR